MGYTQVVGAYWELFAVEKLAAMNLPVVHVPHIEQHRSTRTSVLRDRPRFDVIVGTDIAVDVKFRKKGRGPWSVRVSGVPDYVIAFIEESGITRCFVVPCGACGPAFGAEWVRANPQFENAWRLIAIEYKRRKHIEETALRLRDL